jgi:predicted nucleic-acid-binding protein
VKVSVDTNVLVRYLTWDAEEQAIKAATILESGYMIVISTIVLCELVWVLKRAYRYPGEEIVNVVRDLIQTRNAEIDRPAAEVGLQMLARGGDFADGVIQHDAGRAKCDRVVTFDQDFARLSASATPVVELLGTAQNR